MLFLLLGATPDAFVCLDCAAFGIWNCFLTSRTVQRVPGLFHLMSLRDGFRQYLDTKLRAWAGAQQNVLWI